MPTLACAMVGICGCGFSCPFSMMRNLRFDEVKGPKNLGRHQGPTALGDRPSPMSAVSRAPNPVGLWRSHTRNKGGKQHKWTTLPPLAVIAGLSPFKGGARRAGDYGPAISYALGIHPCRRFASSRGTKRSIYARFM